MFYWKYDLYSTLLSCLSSYNEVYYEAAHHDIRNQQHTELFEAIRDKDTVRARETVKVLIKMGEDAILPLDTEKQ